jgi:sugar lactone lactonase YvrE
VRERSAGEPAMNDSNHPQLAPQPFFSGLVFAEAPRWHDDRLWLSDQHAHKVVAINQEQQSETMLELGDMPSGLGWMPDGSLLVASMRDQLVLRATGQQVEVHADLNDIARGHLNDMTVDSRGRAYVGQRRQPFPQVPSMAATPEDLLVLIECDGSHRIVASELVSPNGCGITADGKTLVLSETRARRLTAFDISDDGSLSGRRVFAELPSEHPDGICLDEAGGVWLGGAGAAFVRVVEGGEVTDTIPVVGSGRAIACVLGDADRRTLYMLIDIVTEQQVLALTSPDLDALSGSVGRVERVRVEISGAGIP